MKIFWASVASLSAAGRRIIQELKNLPGNLTPAQTGLLDGMGSLRLALVFGGFRRFDLGQAGRGPKVGESEPIDGQQVAAIG